MFDRLSTLILSILQRQSGINLLNGTYVDGTLYCRFIREVKTVVEGKTFDLLNDQYHILLSAGSSLKGKFIGISVLYTYCQINLNYLKY